MERIVLHLDLDYFYAQVEEVDHPEYRGKPVVVCVYSGRDRTSGAVGTANYTARKYGVKSGMPIKAAIAKLGERDAVFVPVRIERYAEVSAAIMEEVARCGEKFEYASIDEGVLELTQTTGGDFEKAETVAKKIKRKIVEKFGLTCSIGIGPNRLIAKIASDFNKPDGLTVVKSVEAQGFLDALEVRKIPGIGPKSSEVLNSIGIRAISDLRRADPAKIVELFGKKTGSWLINAAKGIDETPVGIGGGQKQISRILTLKQDSRDIDYIMGAMEELIEEIIDELKGANLSFSVVGVNAIDSSMKTYAKSRTLHHPSQDAEEMGKTARVLFGELMAANDAEFRRAGIRVEGLESKAGQKSLSEF